MQLRIFRSLWGIDREWETVIPELANLGYYGIEASLSDVNYYKDQGKAFKQLLNQSGLHLIVGVYTSWDDYEGVHQYKSVQEHLQQYRVQLEQAKTLNPVHINAHSGSDSFTDEQAIEYFASALEIEKELGVIVSHETHRGRILYNPFRASMLISKFPDLKLTLDFSHWIVVCERLLGENEYESEMLEKIASKCWHIHARVGQPQHAQVGNLSDHKEDVRVHERMWLMVWRHANLNGRDWTSATPEYGPPPYTPVSQQSDHTSENLWNLCNQQMDQLRKLYRY